MIPRLTTVNDGAFLADDTLIGSYELGGGWLRVERAKIGKRAFVGNSGMTAPGPQGAEAGAGGRAVGGAARRKAKAGTSWLGSPPVRAAPAVGEQVDDSRTYDPPTRLKVARGLVELCRLRRRSWSRVGARRRRRRRCSSALVDRDPAGLVAASLAGLVLMVAGAVAAGVATAREVGAGRTAPRGGPPAVELVRVAQRAGRHVRRGGRGAVVRAGRDRHARCSTSGCAPWARRSAAGCGARRTGCPRPTWSTSATG